MIRINMIRQDMRHPDRRKRHPAHGSCEFAGVVEAVACAVAIQRGMAERNAPMARDRRIVLRIGINLGDVIVEGDDIYGGRLNAHPAQ